MAVIEQLTEYCDCLTNGGFGDISDSFEKASDELVNLISSYTCWAQKPCETFLQSERREVIEVPNCRDDCDIFEFEPFYAPFDPDSFTFTLIEQNGITETSIPLTSYLYSEADEKFRMELPLPNCKCRPNCGCKSTYKLVVEYVAGYEEIPECLLPMFCDALKYIIDKNKCDCEECQDCTNQYDTEGRIDYSTLEGRLQEHFITVLSTQYFRQLGLISLCQLRTTMWGIKA